MPQLSCCWAEDPGFIDTSQFKGQSAAIAAEHQHQHYQHAKPHAYVQLQAKKQFLLTSYVIVVIMQYYSVMQWAILQR